MPETKERNFFEKLSEVLEPIEKILPERKLPGQMTIQRTDLMERTEKVKDAKGKKAVEAAVIAPVIVNDKEPEKSEILLTLRTLNVKDHKGQVSFPGGVFEERDKNLLRTAIRETEEETGIKNNIYKFAGMLRPYDTITGYRIYPFVAVLNNKPELNLNRIEIEKAFYVPLNFLIDDRNIKEYEIEWQGHNIKVKAYKWDDMIIWGATFNIIGDLSERLRKIL